MSCGNLFKTPEGKIFGTYKVWGKTRLDFEFVKSNDPGEKAPDFVVVAKDPVGDTCDIGVVYQNEIKKGEKTGLPCFSILFQNPGLFKESLRVSAFPSTADGLNWEMEYEKEKRNSESGAPLQAVG